MNIPVAWLQEAVRLAENSEHPTLIELRPLGFQIRQQTSDGRLGQEFLISFQELTALKISPFPHAFEILRRQMDRAISNVG